jgi:hypothetical protein
MDIDTHEPLPVEDLTDDILAGVVVFGPEQIPLGTVEQLYGADIAGYAVITLSTEGAVRPHSVAVPMRDISFVRDQTGNVCAVTEWTQSELDFLPSFNDWEKR